MLFPESLKLPMDAYLHVCRREVSCYHARTKAKISSDVLGPKIAISQFQIQKIAWRNMPPDSPSFCIQANVCTRVQVAVSWTNAILLPPGLLFFYPWLAGDVTDEKHTS